MVNAKFQRQIAVYLRSEKILTHSQGFEPLAVMISYSTLIRVMKIMLLFIIVYCKLDDAKAIPIIYMHLFFYCL